MNQAQAMTKLDEAIFALFGKAVTYTPAGGQAKEIAAVVHFGEVPGERGARRGQSAQEHVARIVIRADATLGVSTPARRDEVTVDAPSGAQETWLVDKVVEGDGAVWKLDLIRDRRPVPGI